MSVLPFPSFLDDVKEKGLRKAVFEGADEVVERLTAGLNVQDVRDALRGEDPTRRPNPRLQPHADGFWLHMRPSYYNRQVTGLYPSFRLGWLSTYFVFFETITGIILMFWYTPSPEIAYGNMLSMLNNVPFGQFTRDLHRLGAEAMVLIVFLHMLRTFYTGSYKKPRQFTWFTGVLLLIFTGFLSFTGYLLPWDQLALWAVTIGASMAEATPLVGEQVNLLVRGGPEMGANGLLRFYMAHVLLLPVLLFIFTGVHYYKVVIHGHSLPPREENPGEDTAKRVPLDRRVYFIPDVLTSELMWFGVTSFILIVLCIWFYHAPLESHADPQVTPLGTTAPWYFLWIQGALKLGDKTFWGVIFPGILLGFLMVVPYIDLNPARRFAQRRLAFSISFLMLTALVVTSYMGLAEFGVATAPDQEILNELTFEPAHNHMGLLRPVNFDQLATGAFTTREFAGGAEHGPSGVAAFNDMLQQNGEMEHLLEHLETQFLSLPTLRFTPVPANAPELVHVLEEFAHLLEAEQVELLDSWGVVIITPNQGNLKRLDVVINWQEVEIVGGTPVLDDSGNPIPVFNDDGAPVRRTSSVHIFINEQSGYFN
ncbi:MAG: cytochrome bc complex cytochrome b subunit [Anaerolineaceae bacterium]|nr:cytochrome bc complex cytochrome b subunit [Anaerolineaceae bacterium]MDE0329067.1 cytochrome bc complex cytochrome b subunit [Anaerolineaceae bacterium]